LKMYKPGIESNLKKKLGKLFKKDRKRYEIVMKKMEEILQNPHHYKSLSHDVKHLRRVHIDSSFVLVFYINENDEIVLFVDIDHHDKIMDIQKIEQSSRLEFPDLRL
jgi:YafQ family addiction module toxin component